MTSGPHQVDRALAAFVPIHLPPPSQRPSSLPGSSVFLQCCLAFESPNHSIEALGHGVHEVVHAASTRFIGRCRGPFVWIVEARNVPIDADNVNPISPPFPISSHLVPVEIFNGAWVHGYGAGDVPY